MVVGAIAPENQRLMSAVDEADVDGRTPEKTANQRPFRRDGGRDASAAAFVGRLPGFRRRLPPVLPLCRIKGLEVESPTAAKGLHRTSVISFYIHISLYFLALHRSLSRLDCTGYTNHDNSLCLISTRCVFFIQS